MNGLLNNIKGKMNNIINILSDKWNGFIFSGGTWTLGMVFTEFQLNLLGGLTLITSLVIAIFTIIGLVQKQIDRYERKKKERELDNQNV